MLNKINLNIKRSSKDRRCWPHECKEALMRMPDADGQFMTGDTRIKDKSIQEVQRCMSVLG